MPRCNVCCENEGYCKCGEQSAEEQDKRNKAEPTEVGLFDLLIEIQKLKGEIFGLKERVRALENNDNPIASHE